MALYVFFENKISRPPRYDRFDIPPYEIVLAKVRENCEMGKMLGAGQPLEIADYLAKSPIISSFRKGGVTERRVFQDRLVMTASISLRI